MLEVAEDLPVAAVEGAVGHPQQLGGGLHVDLFVLDALHDPPDGGLLPELLAGAEPEVVVDA